jgi:hypothetical protein
MLNDNQVEAYTEQTVRLQAEIDRLKERRSVFMEALAKHKSPFKEGDKIIQIRTGERAKVTEVFSGSAVGSFKVIINRIKKDGTFYKDMQKLWSHEVVNWQVNV